MNKRQIEIHYQCLASLLGEKTDQFPRINDTMTNELASRYSELLEGQRFGIVPLPPSKANKQWESLEPNSRDIRRK